MASHPSLDTMAADIAYGGQTMAPPSPGHGMYIPTTEEKISADLDVAHQQMLFERTPDMVAPAGAVYPVMSAMDRAYGYRKDLPARTTGPIAATRERLRQQLLSAGRDVEATGMRGLAAIEMPTTTLVQRENARVSPALLQRVATATSPVVAEARAIQQVQQEASSLITPPTPTLATSGVLPTPTVTQPSSEAARVQYPVAPATAVVPATSPVVVEARIAAVQQPTTTVQAPAVPLAPVRPTLTSRTTYTTGTLSDELREARAALARESAAPPPATTVPISHTVMPILSTSGRGPATSPVVTETIAAPRWTAPVLPAGTGRIAGPVGRTLPRTALPSPPTPPRKTGTTLVPVGLSPIPPSADVTEAPPAEVRSTILGMDTWTFVAVAGGAAILLYLAMRKK
jgi:hypothetical protein